MIRGTHARRVLFLTAFFCGGCGTLNNIVPIVSKDDESPPPTRIYGGVSQDWAAVKALDWSDVAGPFSLLFLPLYLADFPLSLVGDTATLPYTIGVEIIRSINDYYFPKPPPNPERP